MSVTWSRFPTVGDTVNLTVSRFLNKEDRDSLAQVDPYLSRYSKSEIKEFEVYERGLTDMAMRSFYELYLRICQLKICFTYRSFKQLKEKVAEAIEKTANNKGIWRKKWLSVEEKKVVKLATLLLDEANRVRQLLILDRNNQKEAHLIVLNEILSKPLRLDLLTNMIFDQSVIKYADLTKLLLNELVKRKNDLETSLITKLLFTVVLRHDQLRDEAKQLTTELLRRDLNPDSRAEVMKVHLTINQ